MHGYTICVFGGGWKYTRLLSRSSFRTSLRSDLWARAIVNLPDIKKETRGFDFNRGNGPANPIPLHILNTGVVIDQISIGNDTNIVVDLEVILHIITSVGIRTITNNIACIITLSDHVFPYIWLN
jgi:hypothetical protein